MHHDYGIVTTRFLRDDERLIQSEEKHLPLVIEPKGARDSKFLQSFLATHSEQLIADMAQYGAVLLRGFDIQTEEDFENTVLSLKGFRGISEAFMSEHGRIHVGNLKFVLHTNAVYKTGGTLYLGGFHSENYYSADVPSYICFCCLKPSEQGGETGLVNMEKVYDGLDEDLKKRLENNSFFVSKWLIAEVAKRYKIQVEEVEKVCAHFDLPIVGNGEDKFVLMYKPSIFKHPLTNKKALQINLFELPTLNPAMRKCFINDYKGPTWFWHRFVWRLPEGVFKVLEHIYVAFASFFYSPRESFAIMQGKFNDFRAMKKKDNLPEFNAVKVRSCFTDKNVEDLAQLIRNYYSSCLWQKGDILLVDNKKVAHAGMPGAGPRLVRAMICNPLDMKYSFQPTGCLNCQTRTTETVGYYLHAGNFTSPSPVTEEQN